MKRLEGKHMTRIVFTTMALCVSSQALAQTHQVSTTQELRDAVSQANPGDRILLADGTYRLDDRLRIDRPGTLAEPIVIEAVNMHQARIEVNTVEGIVWSAAHWQMEGLHFKGVCGTPGDCEHALHIVADADGLVIRHNVFEDFNAQIKGNGVQQSDGTFLMPDDVLIEANELFDNAARPTSAPVTKIDVVGGSNWTVRGNFIHDFAKAEGNQISYAAFLKGKSTGGVFERNLVACEALHSGQIRLGLSFGGGGTGDQFCPGGTCTPEHSDGVMRNNIIAKCPADVGIYLNKSANTLIESNTLYDNSGIDIRFDSSDAILRHNLITGRIRERDGGLITAATGNLVQLSNQDFDDFFLNPAALDFTLVDGSMFVDRVISPTPTHDFCGQPRQPNAMDIGAIEYLTPTPCDTSTIPPTVMMTTPGEDMGGMPSEDMGSMGEDMALDMSMPGEDMALDMNQAQDMDGAVEDMSAPSQQDMSTSPLADMSSPEQDMSLPGQPIDQEDEGCTIAASPGHSRGGRPATTLLLVGLVIGLLRRRRATTRPKTIQDTTRSSSNPKHASPQER